jgi:hypothetical protein
MCMKLRRALDSSLVGDWYVREGLNLGSMLTWISLSEIIFVYNWCLFILIFNDKLFILIFVDKFHICMIYGIRINERMNGTSEVYCMGTPTRLTFKHPPAETNFIEAHWFQRIIIPIPLPLWQESRMSLINYYGGPVLWISLSFWHSP